MSKHIVVLTGAGISAESGIKTFRDSDGLWMGYDIREVATPGAWQRNPSQVLKFYNERRRDIAAAEPNAAHRELASLEKEYQITIVTQNIDDLHERAGSKNVVHLHGEIFKMRSTASENMIFDIRGDMDMNSRDPFGNLLRPHIVWFEEPVPMIEYAAEIMLQADIFLLIGTSLQVYPAAGLIDYVGEEIPKFIIDKKIPDVNRYQNIIAIERTATEGMKEFRRLLPDYL